MDSEKAERFEDFGSITAVRTVFSETAVGMPVNMIRFMAICKECGSLVPYEARELHLSWHSMITEAFLK